MASTNDIGELAERIFEESNLALDETFTDRVRQLGDAFCKAGIESAITYLSEKSQLSEAELQILSGGSLPEHYKLRILENHIERLKRDAHIEPNDQEKSLCFDAFDSGLSAALLHLLKTAELEDVDLLSIIPSRGQ